MKMATSQPAASLPYWIEWKRRCALGKCAEEAGVSLRGFAFHRFHYYARRVGLGVGAVPLPGLALEIDAVRAWHLFETYLLVKATREGKRYKDWLFARLDGNDGASAEIVESGATLIMRDVVREHLRREAPSVHNVSLHMPLAAGEGATVTLEDLLPGGGDPVGEVARAEYPGMAEAIVGRLFGELAWRTRVAILAKILGRTLADPVVVMAAECGKSVLSADYAAFRQAIKARICSEFVDEGPAGVAELLLAVVQRLQARIFLWAKSEKACASLFVGIEGECVDDA